MAVLSCRQSCWHHTASSKLAFLQAGGEVLWEGMSEEVSFELKLLDCMPMKGTSGMQAMYLLFGKEDLLFFLGRVNGCKI